MNEKRTVLIRLLFIVGFLMTVGAPFIPSFLYNIIQGYDYRYHEIRFAEIIPSIRTAGILLSLWGIVLFVKTASK